MHSKRQFRDKLPKRDPLKEDSPPTADRPPDAVNRRAVHILLDACLFTLDSTQEIFFPNDSQEISLQMYTDIFSLEVRMVEILMDLNSK